MFVDHSKFTEVKGEFFMFAADASDLRLRPGQWPARIQTNLGNGEVLVAGRILEDAAREFAGYEYKQSMGCITVRIYND